MNGFKAAAIVFMVLGVLLTLVGLKFQVMQWPDVFKGTITGPMAMVIGLWFLGVHRAKKRS